jgi:hypothetical protein
MNNNQKSGNTPNTDPVECFLCGRGMVPRGSRFCSPRCQEAFDSGFPRHDPHHVRSAISLELRSWKVAAPAPGSPPVGASNYGPLLDRLRPTRKLLARPRKMVSGPQPQKPKFVQNNPAASMSCEGFSR